MDMEEWEIQQLERCGFFVHYVPLNNNNANIHTHGISELFSHLDLQIVLPIRPETATGILHTIVDQIKNGYRFEKEGCYDTVIHDFPVHLVKRKEMDREVMRIILPDEHGRFYPDIEQDNIYSYQHKVII